MSILRMLRRVGVALLGIAVTTLVILALVSSKPPALPTSSSTSRSDGTHGEELQPVSKQEPALIESVSSAASTPAPVVVIRPNALSDGNASPLPLVERRQTAAAAANVAEEAVKLAVEAAGGRR